MVKVWKRRKDGVRQRYNIKKRGTKSCRLKVVKVIPQGTGEVKFIHLNKKTREKLGFRGDGWSEVNVTFGGREFSPVFVRKQFSEFKNDDKAVCVGAHIGAKVGDTILIKPSKARRMPFTGGLIRVGIDRRTGRYVNMDNVRTQTRRPTHPCPECGRRTVGYRGDARCRSCYLSEVYF